MWTEPDSNRRPHHCPDPDPGSGSRMLDWAFSGPSRTRTGDLIIANDAFYQLNYRPNRLN